MEHGEGGLLVTEETDLLYARLLGETATITWPELEPFFARGALLYVHHQVDLIEVAQAVAEDHKEKVTGWLSARQLEPLQAEQALQWQTGQSALWAVVVAPWVLVQERSSPLH